MGQRKMVLLLSLCLVLISVLLLAVRGLNFGQEFTGGVTLQLGFPHSASRQAPVEEIREQLDLAGFQQATVVTFGSNTDIMIRLATDSDPLLGDKLLDLLQSRIDPGIKLISMDYVGPQVGGELRESGGLALLLALALVGLYITYRFQAKFAIAAVLALFHDVLITLGCFSISHWDFNLTVLAGILAVIGYSINDTIVVFDRIREVFRKERKTEPVLIINSAISSTLDRTLATSFTTLLVLFALAIFGGSALFGFSIALIIGIGVGTYSSIYVAASLLLSMDVQQRDLFPPPDPKVGQDG
jgi:preprotein translocase subunit SecF